MDNTDLPNLACLYAVQRVAETGSVSRAAATLFRAQSAVTRAVQELETAVGEALFERKPSGMLATPVGRAVLKRGERVIAELGALANWCALRQSRRRASADGSLPAYLLNARRLQLFSTLARHGHMPSAARALGVTQPAVSSAIRILESGAGFALFHRHPRGLLLTADGETFLLHVRRALNELRHVANDVAALHGSIQGVVTVGALPLGRTLMLPEAVARVVTRFPKVRVVTDESAYEALVAGVRAGDIDFILGALRASDPASDLENERLMSENLVVLARRDHPLAGVRNLGLASLAGARAVRIAVPAHEAQATNADGRERRSRGDTRRTAAHRHARGAVRTAAALRMRSGAAGRARRADARNDPRHRPDDVRRQSAVAGGTRVDRRNPRGRDRNCAHTARYGRRAITKAHGRRAGIASCPVACVAAQSGRYTARLLA